MKMLTLILLPLLSSAAMGAVLQPEFEGKDANRSRIRIGLTPVLTGLVEPTDIRFLPGSSHQLIVTEKAGKVRFFDLKKKSSQAIGTFKVHSHSELGVLGGAFHPKFPKVNKVYLNYNPNDRGPMRTRISEFEWVVGRGVLSAERVLLEIPQPYSNHNAGQLQFGPDGMLYIGTGDGGSANDPQGNGQNPGSWLGKMLRINVDKKTKQQPYTVPSDNPFTEKKEFLPEIFAWGLRNPWRFSFDDEGKLITGDVGQYEWEEISFVPRGGNLGWNTMEANHCFRAKECKAEGLVPAFVEYGHDEGASVTGGYVYKGPSIAELRQKYVFGDYSTGRIWALSVPSDKQAKNVAFEALGKWPVAISTFGRDAAGEMYLADFNDGVIYQFSKVK
jgi:glucose/arabinose dehydrogenase